MALGSGSRKAGEPVDQLHRPRESCARCRQLLPPPRDGLVVSCGLQHVLQHVGGGLVRAQQLFRPLRLFDSVLNDRMGMVLGIKDKGSQSIKQTRVS